MDLELVDYAASRGRAFIPGVATPTELNGALKKCAVIKLFPASTLGGPEYIKAVAAPFRTKDFHLVPTGGVNQDNFLEYLKQDRVISVGHVLYRRQRPYQEGGLRRPGRADEKSHVGPAVAYRCNADRIPPCKSHSKRESFLPIRRRTVIAFSTATATACRGSPSTGTAGISSCSISMTVSLPATDDILKSIDAAGPDASGAAPGGSP